MPVFLIMSPCNDPYYGGSPVGPAFNCHELAQRWITNTLEACRANGYEYEGHYYIDQFDVQLAE